MIYVDTRSAKTHRILRYLGVGFKTTVLVSSLICAYFIAKYGV